MTYHTQAALSSDGALRERIAACAAAEGIKSPHPTSWADEHQWQLAASPGWDAAYAHALATGVQNPGADASVITDGMILAAVQPLILGTA